MLVLLLNILILTFLYLYLSLGAHHIKDNHKNNMGRNKKFIKPQQEKARHEEGRKQIRVKFLE